MQQLGLCIPEDSEFECTRVLYFIPPCSLQGGFLFETASLPVCWIVYTHLRQTKGVVNALKN